MSRSSFSPSRSSTSTLILFICNFTVKKRRKQNYILLYWQYVSYYVFFFSASYNAVGHFLKSVRVLGQVEEVLIFTNVSKSSYRK